MGDSFDAFRYIGYMRSRWRLIAASCGIAAVLAVTASMLMPREYTATARIVIEPPAGTDLRSAMAVSPIYLESLKTYEQFAAGDSLFQKAVDKFNLRSGSVESLKKRVLKVGLVRNTRILEIAATLPDARKAQALAQFLAESAVELNRSTVTDSDQDLIRGIEQQRNESHAYLERVDSAWAQQLAKEPVDGLQQALEKSAEVRSTMEQQVLGAELEVADAARRARQAVEPELSRIRQEEANARARLEEMRRQLQTIDRQNAGRERTLAIRSSHRDRMEAERKSAQTALTAAETRLREARSESGFRGERLKIIDQGIVPERPSSPNLPLNLAAALLLGLMLPVVYLTLEMNYREQRAGSRWSVFHSVAKARDE